MRFRTLLILFALVVVTVALAQVLGDGEFANLLAEDSVVLGDNTDKDFTTTWNQSTTDYTLTYSDTSTQFQWLVPSNGLRLGTASANPTLGFYDGDLSGASPLNHATLFMQTDDATVGDEFTSFNFQSLGNGALNTAGGFVPREDTAYGLDSAVYEVQFKTTLASYGTVVGGISTYNSTSSGYTCGGTVDDYMYGAGDNWCVGNDWIAATANAYDLGNASFEWQDLYLAGNLYFGTGQDVNMTSDGAGEIQVSDDLYITDDLTVADQIIVGTGGAILEDSTNDGVLDITIDVPIVFSSFLDINEQFVNQREHGNLISLVSAQTINNSPTNITVSPGISKLLIVLNTCSDALGTITVTGTSVNRDTKAETGSDTDSITIAGTTLESTATDSQGNSKWNISGGYITEKWFKGSTTLSTSDISCTDVDVHQVAFEQVNDQSGLTLNTLDISTYITNTAGWLYAYLYLLEVDGDTADVSLIGQVSIDPPVANKQYRLRHGALARAFDGTTDGFWLEVHLGGSGANTYHQSLNTKVWVTQTITVN